MLQNINFASWNRRKTLILLGIIILLVVILEIWTVNRLATLGNQINKLENAKETLSLENEVLKSIIAQKSSLQTVEKAAKNAGFVKIKNVQPFQPAGLALNH